MKNYLMSLWIILFGITVNSILYAFGGDIQSLLESKMAKKKLEMAFDKAVNNLEDLNGDNNPSDCGSDDKNLKPAKIVCRNLMATGKEPVELEAGQIWGREGDPKTMEIIDKNFQLNGEIGLDQISRKHFKIIEENGFLVIEDTSTNGTTITEKGSKAIFLSKNGEKKFKLNPEKLTQITFGGFQLICTGKHAEQPVSAENEQDLLRISDSNEVFWNEKKCQGFKMDVYLKWKDNSCVYDSMLVALFGGEPGPGIWKMLNKVEPKKNKEDIRKEVNRLKDYFCSGNPLPEHQLKCLNFRMALYDNHSTSSKKSQVQPGKGTNQNVAWSSLAEIFPSMPSPFSSDKGLPEDIETRLNEQSKKYIKRKKALKEDGVFVYQTANLDHLIDNVRIDKSQPFNIKSIVFTCVPGEVMSHECSIIKTKDGWYQYDGMKNPAYKIISKVNDPSYMEKIKNLLKGRGNSLIIYEEQRKDKK